ncbi:MAG: hypothetical protein Q4E59_05455 [Bacteroidales bacterium]|nr:hypothetical protein [Bacteroidales bacterium]
MASKNDITKRTASIRKWFTMPLVEKYDNLFKDSGTDFVAIVTDNHQWVVFICIYKIPFHILQY